MMRGSAGLDPNQAWLQPLEKRQDASVACGQRPSRQHRCDEPEKPTWRRQDQLPSLLASWLLRIVGPSTTPTSIAVPCRWRSRPQHQMRTSPTARAFRPDRPTSRFVVIHLPGGHPPALDAMLSQPGRLPATFAQDGEALKRRHIYIAPLEMHLLLDGERLRLGHGPRENNSRRQSSRCFGRQPSAAAPVLSVWCSPVCSGMAPRVCRRSSNAAASHNSGSERRSVSGDANECAAPHNPRSCSRRQGHVRPAPELGEAACRCAVPLPQGRRERGTGPT